MASPGALTFGGDQEGDFQGSASEARLQGACAHAGADASTNVPMVRFFRRKQTIDGGSKHSCFGDKLLRAGPKASEHGPVEQLECSPPCQGGGRGFKSRQDRSG